MAKHRIGENTIVFENRPCILASAAVVGPKEGRGPLGQAYDLAVDDALAVDKIYIDNAQTNLAIFGRTPTRDGEQLVYWNNLDMANSKQRSTGR